MPRPKERTPELRERILENALDLLGRDGVAAITTRRVAESAGTSVPAVYELFGDKSGLVRELFFEGFRRLEKSLDALDEPDDPIASIRQAVTAFRTFALAERQLFEVMFSHPFEAFRPGAEERRIGDATRRHFVDRVRRAVDRGVLEGDPVDIAHVLLALAIGLAEQETAGWLGSTRKSRDRRWEIGVSALLEGLSR